MSRRIKCGEPDPDGEYGCEVMEGVIDMQRAENKQLIAEVRRYRQTLHQIVHVESKPGSDIQLIAKTALDQRAGLQEIG